MKRNFKRVFAASMSALMLAGSFSISSANTKVFASSVKKPDKITFMVGGTLQMGDGNGAADFCKAFKELTGVELSINQPAHNEYVEKVNLAFTSGAIPDVLVLNTNNYLKFSSYGALVDVTKYYDNSEIKKNVTNQNSVDALRIGGKLYGIPQQAGNGTVTYVRGDWLDKLKLEMPKNYYEFLEMLKAFRDKDPDGDGKKNTIAITSAGLVNTEFPLDIYLREFYQDGTPDFVQKNGKWVDGMLEPEMQAALTRMVEAFKEGLIDKEIVTNKTSTARDKFTSGKVGVFNYWAGTWNDTLQINISRTTPTAKVVPMPAIANAKYIERIPAAVGITSKAKDPEAIFKYFIETMLDAGAGQKLFTLGVENVSYKVENGKTTFLNQISSPTSLFSKSFIEGPMSITNFKNPIAYPDAIVKSLDVYRKSNQYAVLFPSSSAYSDTITDLNNIRTQVVNNIVYGDVTLEDGLAKYKKDSAAYVDAILKDFNKGK